MFTTLYSKAASPHQPYGVMMKMWTIYSLLALLLITSVPLPAQEPAAPATGAPQEQREGKIAASKKRAKKKPVRRTRKRIKAGKKRYAKNRIARQRNARKRSARKQLARKQLARKQLARKQIARKQLAHRERAKAKKRPRTVRRQAPVRAAITQQKPAIPDSVRIAERPLPPAPSKKPAKKTAAGNKTSGSPRVITTGDTWRAACRRSIAQSPSGEALPFETLAGLHDLFRTLPDEGEIRVRYGIYQGTTARGPEKRFDEEQRNLVIPCWLYGARYINGNPEGNIQLIIGSSGDPAHAQYMIAEIPSISLHKDDPVRFEDVRRRLLELVQQNEIYSDFTSMAPRQIVVEGTLFFNGRRGAGGPLDPGPSWAKPGTVWELQPVTAIRGTIASN